MRRIFGLAGICAALLSAEAFAQSADDFDAWMRTIDEKNQSVQRNIAAKDAQAASDDARTMQEAFRLVEGFWKQRGHAEDAVELAQKAEERAAEVVKSIAAKDFEAASAQSIKIAETCTACHRLYRPLF
jgi:3,4-dihydroxy-2-butanone 4-phosphate synthase